MIENARHAVSHGHGDAAAFDDEGHVSRLEAEGRLASGLHDQAARRCAELLDRANVTVGRVLDLGCGPGVATVGLAQQFPSARVVAVDGSAKMLRRVEALVARHAVDARVETRLMDLDGELGPLGAADLIWAAMALHHAADEMATLHEVRELLAPEGLLCVLERAEPTVVQLATDLGRPGIWERLTAAWSACWRRERRTLPGGTNAGRYSELLGSAGLDVVDMLTLRNTVTAPDDQATRAFVVDHLTAVVRALEALAESADLWALQAWIDDPAAREWGATVTCSRELLIARAGGKGMKSRAPAGRSLAARRVDGGRPFARRGLAAVPHRGQDRRLGQDASSGPSTRSLSHLRHLVATATMREIAPIWVRWHDAGARQLAMCVRGSPYGTPRWMPLMAQWR